MADKTFRGLTNRLRALEISGGGGGGGGTEYIHTQIAPSLTWTVLHGLTHKPVVEIYDTTGTQVEGEIDSSVAGQTTITLTAATAGSATCV